MAANDNTRRTCRTASPARIARALATSTDARVRLQSMMWRWAGPSLLGSPVSGISLRKRYWICRSAWVATNVPLPWRRTSRFSDANSSMALRTVPWLTLNRAANSISLGMAALGFHSPACRLCSIKTLICWYSGLNAGVGCIGAMDSLVRESGTAALSVWKVGVADMKRAYESQLESVLIWPQSYLI